MSKHLITLIFISILLFTSVCISSQQYHPSQQLTVGQCKNITTICRKPQIVTDYNYKGVIRSGYLSINSKQSSALGFTFYGKQNAKQEELKNYPIILVLGGGPGLSSQFSNLKQVGPFVLKKVFAVSIQANPYGWTKDANLLFIDQPLGTGVTCLNKQSDIPTTMSQIIKDLYQAMYQLYSEDSNGCFNSKQLGIPPSTPLYIFGEGYAAKYVSAFATKLLQQQKNGGIITGLKGIGIGSALIAPIKILQQFGNYAFSMSLLDYQERVKMQKILIRATLEYGQKKMKQLTKSFEKAINYLYDRSGINIYDITKDGIDQGISMLNSFFANKTNLNRYGFQDNPFQAMSNTVYNKLQNQFMLNEIHNIQYILKQQIPILVYQGQDNAYVNPTGAIKWVDQLNYSNSRQFRNTDFIAWKVNGKMLGSKKSYGKLTYIVVNNAGHYVPQDNPQAALYMIRDFINTNK